MSEKLYVVVCYDPYGREEGRTDAVSYDEAVRLVRKFNADVLPHRHEIIEVQA